MVLRANESAVEFSDQSTLTPRVSVSTTTLPAPSRCAVPAVSETVVAIGIPNNLLVAASNGKFKCSTAVTVDNASSTPSKSVGCIKIAAGAYPVISNLVTLLRSVCSTDVEYACF